jgi:serine protease Do
MTNISMQSRRIYSARRVALLTTAIAAIGGAAVALAPHMPAYTGSAQAQNLTEKVQQLPQRPVGFADIVEKVKPAVISVRVKIDRPADAGLGGGDDDLPPFPPGSPFERFFKRFGAPNGGQPGGHQ